MDVGKNKGMMEEKGLEMIKTWDEGNWDIYNLSSGGGIGSSNAHCKHVVGLNASDVPVFATTGSYNLTGGAPTSLEALDIYHDPEPCKHYLAKVESIIHMAKYHTRKIERQGLGYF